MANELRFSASIRASKAGANVSDTSNVLANMTGGSMIQATQLIGTTAALVSFGDITGAPQLVMIKNLSSTNFVEIGGNSDLDTFKLKIPAGQSALFAPSSATVYAKANTASVEIAVTAVEA